MHLITPESDFESAMLRSQALRDGLIWRIPRRSGAQEHVFEHVQVILGRIEINRRFFSEFEYRVLRFLAIVHDSFKYQVDPDQPKVGENNHAWLAAAFAEQYAYEFTIRKDNILAMIINHDEAYNTRKTFLMNVVAAKVRLGELLSQPIGNWELLLAFSMMNGSHYTRLDNAFWFESVLIEHQLIETRLSQILTL